MVNPLLNIHAESTERLYQSQEPNKQMIHLYSDPLTQRPNTVTMDTSHGDGKE